MRVGKLVAGEGMGAVWAIFAVATVTVTTERDAEGDEDGVADSAAFSSLT